MNSKGSSDRESINDVSAIGTKYLEMGLNSDISVVHLEKNKNSFTNDYSHIETTADDYGNKTKQLCKQNPEMLKFYEKYLGSKSQKRSLNELNLEQSSNKRSKKLAPLNILVNNSDEMDRTFATLEQKIEKNNGS